MAGYKKILIRWVLIFLAVISNLFIADRNLLTDEEEVLGASEKKHEYQVFDMKLDYSKYLSPTPSLNEFDSSPKAHGQARQIGEKTWTMDIEDDDRIATPSEIYSALNSYRQKYGRSQLSWDNNLFLFAQSRSDLFRSSGRTDAHSGFNEFIHSQDGFSKLGFMSLGENSSFGYVLSAVNLIEAVYAGDAPHNDNQLNSMWTHVGIGVSGEATDIVFGGGKK